MRADFQNKAIQLRSHPLDARKLGHPHRLRATFATTHYEAGTPISQIQQMMGHKDPSTTMGYIIQRPKDQAEAQDRVAALMGMGGSSTTVTLLNLKMVINH